MDVGDGLVRLQRHIGQRALDGAALDGVLFLVGVGHAVVDGQHHLGRGAPGDLRADLCRVDLDDLVEVRAGIRVQRAPVGHGLLPLHALRAERAALHVVDRRVVHGNQAGAGAGFDRHVADRHAAFHAQRADGRTSKLDGVARATGRADLADDGEHDVLGAAAARQLALNLDEQVLGLLGRQRLRGQHMLDLARADAVRQRTKGAVGGRVAVAADDRHARQRGALLRADHVDDALALVAHLELRDAEAVAVGIERVDLQLGDRVCDALRAVGRRHVVIADGEVGAQAPDLAAGQVQAFEGLRAGHLVHEVAVDVEQRRAIGLGVHDMLVPELVVEGA
mmetsp:Transcript_81659/g.227260  ORF Transcript_81659/g.227260 Transcript_81659/m.227260 type:complete len:337 (+) Transcript_81659:1421-2431(+)